MKDIKIYFCLMIFILPVRLFGYNDDSLAKSHFHLAKQNIVRMLSDSNTASFERGIFEIENAWWGGSIDFNSFEKVLNFHSGNIQKLAIGFKDVNKLRLKDSLDGTKEQKAERYNNLVMNFAIYKYMRTPSLWVDNDKELILHSPYSYSHSDPTGTKDWTNTQVINLLNTGSGNCFALSSLFKIFSVRLNSKASLCTAPGHIFISHTDEKGTRYNIELGSKAFPGTGTIGTITYTTNESVKNGIALRKLDTKQAIALTLVYLAKGYEYKFKDKSADFLLECANLALSYDDHNLNAMLLKAEVM